MCHDVLEACSDFISSAKIEDFCAHPGIPYCISIDKKYILPSICCLPWTDPVASFVPDNYFCQIIFVYIGVCFLLAIVTVNHASYESVENKILYDAVDSCENATLYVCYV